MRAKRPSNAAYAEALEAAKRMREDDADSHFIGVSLLFLHARSRQLEELLTVTDRYLRFGMPEHELSRMRVLVERLREEELAVDDGDDVEATLPI